jgi:hypothetical protein
VTRSALFCSNACGRIVLRAYSSLLRLDLSADRGPVPIRILGLRSNAHQRSAIEGCGEGRARKSDATAQTCRRKNSVSISHDPFPVGLIRARTGLGKPTHRLQRKRTQRRFLFRPPVKKIYRESGTIAGFAGAIGRYAVENRKNYRGRQA